MKPKTFADLWPLPYPEIVIVTGPYGCGKSTFAQGTGALPARTCVIDMEKSATGDAKQIPFGKYLDVQAEMLKLHPKGFTALDLHDYLISQFNEIPQDGFDVIILDNATPLEEALTAKVDKSPQSFGLTANQMEYAAGLKWGAVKTYEGNVLASLASKAKMLIIIMQLRDKWAGKKPVLDEFGQPVKEAKGKETLDMFSSLFLSLDFGPEGIPSALVLKSRISRKVYIEDPKNPPDGITPEMVKKKLNGEPGLITISILPMRIPRCTWAAIRSYMTNPANLLEPAPGEKPEKKDLTEDDRLRLRAIVATAQKDLLEEEKEREQRETAKKIDVGKKRLISELIPKYFRTNQLMVDALHELELTYTLEEHNSIRDKLIALSNSKK
jgi:energy-coupling factor transporter ATP-binding protein EcfA2